MHTFDEKKALNAFDKIVLEQPEMVIPGNAENIFNRKLVVLDNLLARASTKWSLEETKIFLLAVSLIDTIDEKNEVRLPKKDVLEKMGIDTKNSTWLLSIVKKIATKSWVEFTGHRSEGWNAGFIIVQGRYDERNLYLAFNKPYIPLVKELKKHFTSFEIEDILGFSHKGSLNLYMYLTSWFDDRFPSQSQSLKKSDLQKIFCLKEGQYWRNWGKENARFDWHCFEKKVLLPAIEDINGSKDCDMVITEWKKQKEGKTVLGYHFRYCFQDKHTGLIAWRDTEGRLSGEW